MSLPEWQILHNGHHAWYQRSLMPGDFKPGRQPVAFYVVDEDGKAADPTVPPTCHTCGEVPKVEDLEPQEPSTGRSGYLAVYRNGDRPWPGPTDAATCWWCNMPNVRTTGEPPLCPQCVAYLQGK